MKRTIFLFATLLLTTSYASAQSNFAQSVSFAPPDFGASSSAAAALPSSPDSSSAQPAFAATAPFASAFAPPAPLPAAPAPEPQTVQGVFEKYNYDVYRGDDCFSLF